LDFLGAYQVVKANVIVYLTVKLKVTVKANEVAVLANNINTLHVKLMVVVADCNHAVHVIVLVKLKGFLDVRDGDCFLAHGSVP
jgi:hypothetical protein